MSRILDAVVLAGGTGSRMGGVDKPGLTVAGRTLLERVADAVRAHNASVAAAAEEPSGEEAAQRPGGEAGGRARTRTPGRVIVVGPPRRSPSALYVREDPPGSGPLPALGAGLPHVRTPWFALLAADLPHLETEHLSALARAAATGGAGAVFVDAAGRDQWLTGVWRTAAVRTALEGHRGRSLYGLLGPLAHRSVPLADDLAVTDCDTPDDLARARRILEPPTG